MELLSMIIGLVLVMVVFALRAGLGMSFLLARGREPGTKLKVIIGVCLAFAAVFFGSEWVLYHGGPSGLLDFVRDPGEANELWGAAGVGALAWALVLLWPMRSEKTAFWRSFLMALPEPAALLVLVPTTILTLTFSAGSLPGLESLITAGLWLGFSAFALVFMALARSGWFLKESPARGIAAAGLLLSSLFLFHLARPASEPRLIDQVFTIAAFREVDKVQSSAWQYAALAAICGAVFLAGFWSARRKLRRVGT